MTIPWQRFLAAFDRQGQAGWPWLLLAGTVPLLAALGLGLWHTPYAISETIAILEDLQITPPWNFIRPEHAYYRPLFWLTLWGVQSSVIEIPQTLMVFKALHIATVLPVIALLIFGLRPRTLLDAAAVTVAIAVLVGAPAFRDNLENLPLNHMMVIMLIILIVWMLLERSTNRPWHGAAVVALTVVAVGFKEQGLLVAVLVALGHAMGAPGIGRGAVVAACTLAAAYLALRLGLGVEAWPPAQDVGLGFSTLPASAAAAEFAGARRFLLYAYSAGSTAMNILFSEPTSGVFRMMQSLAAGTTGFSQVNHFVSSTAVTMLVLWRGASVLRQEHYGRGPWSREARLFVAFAVMLAGSAALGFSYTRDRFGGVAVIFYALAAFFAVRAAAERLVNGSRTTAMLGVAALLVLATAWQIRAVGTIQYVRETAMTNRKEWLVDLPERRAEFAHRPVYLGLLEALTPQGTDPTALPKGPDPRWFATVFGQR